MKALVNPKHVVAAIDDGVEEATFVWTSDGSVWRLSNINMRAIDVFHTTEPLIAEFCRDG